MTNPNIVKALEKAVSNKEASKFLITVKIGKIVHVNLTLLSHFLEEKKEKGVYISIDRPHKYIELLLRKKKVDQDKLFYIDIATRGTGPGNRSMLSVGGFLWLKILANTFEDIYKEKSQKVDKVNFYKMDFCVMDNASVLPAYNSIDSIREFFAEFGNIVRDHANMKAFIVTPRDLHPKMFETLRNFVDDIIEIPDEWVR